MRQQLTNTAGNITEFKDWVRSQVTQLHARGEQAEDLLAYHWKTYLRAPDRDFVEYVKSLWNSFEDGTSNYTEDQLMLLMENKYKQGSHWRMGKQVEIVALSAQVDVLKKELATKSKMKKQEPRMEDNKDKGTKGDRKWDWQKKTPTSKQ